MIIDFAGCWLIEAVCKYLFADVQPKAMITRERERCDARRKKEERQQKAEEKDAVEIVSLALSVL